MRGNGDRGDGSYTEGDRIGREIVVRRIEPTRIAFEYRECTIWVTAQP